MFLSRNNCCIRSSLSPKYKQTAGKNLIRCCQDNIWYYAKKFPNFYVTLIICIHKLRQIKTSVFQIIFEVLKKFYQPQLFSFGLLWLYFRFARYIIVYLLNITCWDGHKSTQHKCNPVAIRKRLNEKLNAIAVLQPKTIKGFWRVVQRNKAIPCMHCCVPLNDCFLYFRASPT